MKTFFLTTTALSLIVSLTTDPVQADAQPLAVSQAAQQAHIVPVHWHHGWHHGWYHGRHHVWWPGLSPVYIVP